MTISPDLIAREAADRTVFGYAEEYVWVDGKPFSFDRHNYLVDIYLDLHPYIVLEKSAQMGASIYAITKSLFVCDKKGKNVIYFFPTDTDVQDFSKTRVGPMRMDSPHLGKVMAKNDSLGLRQVNRGWLYFRGMKSTIAMKSIPADFLVFDELDEVSDASVSLADQRLNHSALKWRLFLSTPTFENFGIDREFKKSDQRYWNLVCPKCEAKTICEFEFPDCVKQLSESRYILICRKCNAELNPQYGVWIPREPKRSERIHGYHICGLYSAYLDLADLMEEYNEGRRREEFFRSKLGIAYTSAEQRITREMIEGCIREYEMHPESHAFMGVDQKGDELHIVIRKPDSLVGKSNVLFIGKVKRFDQLDEYMRRYDINCCVIDGTPNQHSARDFSERFPGRVFLCYYSETQKGNYNWSEPKESEPDWKVDVNRTEALDAMYEQFQRREVHLPRGTPNEFVTQLTQMARVNEVDEDGAITRAVWKRLGEDHFAHAASYSLVAQSKYGDVRPHSINVKSPVMAKVINTRRMYESGSRF